jgi:Tfp pilus assembly protein PilF
VAELPPHHFVQLLQKVDRLWPGWRAALSAAAARHRANFWVQFDIGYVYTFKDPEPARAVTSLRAALAIRPDCVSALLLLGNQLESSDPEGALACYREAVRVDPTYAQAHSCLGWALQQKGELDGAIASHRKAIRIDPKLARAHNNLGYALQQKGDLDGAVAAFKRALEIEPKNPYALANLPRGERMRELLPRLPAVLASKAQPKGPAEACDFARLCAQSFQKRYSAAARLFEEAFAIEAKLADDLAAAHRYSAACYAARAARGDGVDAPADPGKRAALRGKVLAWLGADLALRKKQAVSADAAGRQAAASALSYWQGDADLSGVREPKALESLPADDRQQWQKLWAEVKATLAEARKPPPPPQRLPP